jgi:SAM-dependent methyltransferase
MDFFDFFNISERYLELLNPTSTSKILTVGQMLGLKPGSRIIDFGCGNGEVLALWAEKFGISGVGIDVREHACQRARQKMKHKGLSDRIEIVCASGSEYRFEPHRFEAALCVGATFIWGGYEPTIRAMRDAITTGGKLVIGEPYWLKEPVPPEYLASIPPIYSEYKLWQIARSQGFDFEYMVRASHDDWDAYEAGNWYGSIRWLEENPAHPERQAVIDSLHTSQETYFKYGREYLGWAIYVLTPQA